MSDLAIFEDERKTQLLKDTICKGATDDEFKLFAYTCKKLGLDPLSRQVYAVKRWDSSLKRETMTVQTGIDGYRLIADRTGRYAPGRASTFEYDDKGNILSATAYVMKQTADGKWHECAYTAHFKEYCAYTKEGKPTHMWATKPGLMISKCAESSCLRRAFPAELSGVYTKEEMEQADNPINAHVVVTISHEQEKELLDLIGDDNAYKAELFGRLNKAFGIEAWSDLPEKQYGAVLADVKKHNTKRMQEEMKA